MPHAKPTIEATRPGYEVRRTEREGLTLWTTGPHAYECGCMMDAENIDAAIDTHEEELHALMAEAVIEFGGSR